MVRGCQPEQNDCLAGRLEVMSPAGAVTKVQVRSTAQIERILARELGKP